VGRYVQVVLGLDDEAPPGPDEAGAGESKVLRKRELLCGTGKVGDAGEDERPLFFCELECQPQHLRCTEDANLVVHVCM